MLLATIKLSPSSSRCFAGINNLFFASRLCLYSPENIRFASLSSCFMGVSCYVGYFIAHFPPHRTTFHHFGDIIIIYLPKICNRKYKIFSKKLFKYIIFPKKSIILPEKRLFFALLICLFTFFYNSFNNLQSQRIALTSPSNICAKLSPLFAP